MPDAFDSTANRRGQKGREGRASSCFEWSTMPQRSHAGGGVTMTTAIWQSHHKSADGDGVRITS